MADAKTLTLGRRDEPEAKPEPATPRHDLGADPNGRVEMHILRECWVTGPLAALGITADGLVKGPTGEERVEYPVTTTINPLTKQRVDEVHYDRTPTMKLRKTEGQSKGVMILRSEALHLADAGAARPVRF